MDAVTPFRHRSFPLSIHAGKDALEQLRGEVDRTKAKRAFIVCGKSVARRTDLLQRIKAILDDTCAGVFDGVEESSPLPSVLRGTAAAREAGADLIIAVGGGSAMVTARAIIILLAEKGDIHEICTQYPPGGDACEPATDGAQDSQHSRSHHTEHGDDTGRNGRDGYRDAAPPRIVRS